MGHSVRFMMLLSATAATATWLEHSDALSFVQTVSSVLIARQAPMCAPIRKYYDETGRVVVETCGAWNQTNPSSWGPKGPQQAIDLWRPLAQVQREHPGNLYPYFGTLNGWLNENNVGYEEANYESYKQGSGFVQPLPDPRPREVTYTWDSFRITTHLDTCSAADDPYCYSLGWLKGQAMDQKYNMARVMDNLTALNLVGIEECGHMKTEFGFTEEEITLGGHIVETSDMYVKTERTCDWHEPSPGPPATVRDFKKHAYAKCFLNNATTEIIYCYFKGCVLENNMIGHSTECSY